MGFNFGAKVISQKTIYEIVVSIRRNLYKYEDTILYYMESFEKDDSECPKNDRDLLDTARKSIPVYLSYIKSDIRNLRDVDAVRPPDSIDDINKELSELSGQIYVLYNKLRTFNFSVMTMCSSNELKKIFEDFWTMLANLNSKKI